MIVLPVGIQFRDWAHQLIQDFGQDALPFPENESAWQDWATLVSDYPSFKGNGNDLPDPADFKDWRHWAERLAAVMNPT